MYTSEGKKIVSTNKAPKAIGPYSQAILVREQNNSETDLNYEANYVADKLISNINMVDMRGQKVIKVTQFDNALTETPVWSPDGEYLPFSTTAGGSGIDVWVLDVKNNKLVQVTHGANTRHPTWLSIP